MPRVVAMIVLGGQEVSPPQLHRPAGPSGASGFRRTAFGGSLAADDGAQPPLLTNDVDTRDSCKRHPVSRAIPSVN